MRNQNGGKKRNYANLIKAKRVPHRNDRQFHLSYRIVFYICSARFSNKSLDRRLDRRRRCKSPPIFGSTVALVMVAAVGIR